VRGLWLLCVPLAVGACDTVWRLDHVGEPKGDAPTDGRDRGDCAGGAHDEDGDQLPDACDLCPGIADDQADVDNDGVGDACDPSPNTQDTIALFISFADPAQLWHGVDGTWSTSDGENLTYASPEFNMTGSTLFQGVMPDPPFTLEYHYRVDTIDVLPSIFGVLVDADSTASGVACGQTRTTNPLEDVVRNTYTAKTLASETPIMTVTPGGYRVTATYDRTGRIQCTLASDDGTTGGGTTLTWTSDKAPAAGALGFRSFQVGASVQYVTIYKHK